MKYLICTLVLIKIALANSEKCSSATGVEGICVHPSKCSQPLSYTNGTVLPKRCSSRNQRCCKVDKVTNRDFVTYDISEGVTGCYNGVEEGFLVPYYRCPSMYQLRDFNILVEKVHAPKGKAHGDNVCCKKEAFNEDKVIKCQNGKGTCTFYYECSTQPFTQLDSRFDTTSNEVKDCPDYWMTCCIAESTNFIRPQFDYESYKGCGYKNDDGIEGVPQHIVPTETQFGEYPWMAAIYNQNSEHLSFMCGGSLITPKVILTVAHYVKKYKEKSLVVRLGEWDMETTSELLKHQDFFVQRTIIHENFDPDYLYNDVALLLLTSEVKLDEPHIGTVCLPPPMTKFDNKKCQTTGWGKEVNDPNGHYVVIMKKMSQTVVSRGECERKLRNTRLTNAFQLHESFICASSEPGSDICEGDGGSPLVCESSTKGRYYQAGIASWGASECGEDAPGGFVGVAKMRSWIDSKMDELRQDKSYYTMT